MEFKITVLSANLIFMNNLTLEVRLFHCYHLQRFQKFYGFKKTYPIYILSLLIQNGFYTVFYQF